MLIKYLTRKRAGNMRKLGTVEKVFAYGKCGFIGTTMDEHYYFSQQSFAANPRRLKVGELVFFDDALQNGKPAAVNLDAETLRR